MRHICALNPASARGNAGYRFSAARQFLDHGDGVCVDNSDYEASLELHKIYLVVPDPDAAQEGDLRIVDDSGEDYLYEGERFVAIESPQALERAVLKKAS